MADIDVMKAAAWGNHADRARALAFTARDTAGRHAARAGEFVTTVERLLAQLHIPFRWAGAGGTRLDLMGPDGQFVEGPDLIGTIAGVESVPGLVAALAGKQPLSPLLTAFAAGGGADALPYFEGEDDLGFATFTAFARLILAGDDAAAVRATLDAQADLGFDPQDSAERGQANGYAPLDGAGKVATSFLPAAVLGNVAYQGAWNAATNSPAIPAAAAGNKGHYYRVATAGTTAIDGEADWKVGDWIVSNGTAWEKIDNTDQVTSVAGKQGVVTLVKADVGLGNVDNTSDVNKPVSTATQNALNLKADASAVAADVAALDSRVDVLEAAGTQVFGIGDMIRTAAAAPTAAGTWLKCGGGAYLKSAYPTLGARLRSRYAAYGTPTTFTSPSSGMKIAGNSERYLALSATTSYLSLTGLSFPSSISHGLSSVAVVKWLHDRFLAVQSNTAMASTVDNSAWTPITATGIFASTTINDAVYGNGKYVLCGLNVSTGYIFYSTDCISWTSVTLTGFGEPKALAFANGLFVVVGANGRIWVSPDAITWTAVASPTATQLVTVDGCEAGFAAATAAGLVYTSRNGRSWGLKDLPKPGTVNVTEIRATLDGKLIVSLVPASGNTIVHESADLEVWGQIGSTGYAANVGEMTPGPSGLLARIGTTMYHSPYMHDPATEFVLPARLETFIKAA